MDCSKNLNRRDFLKAMGIGGTTLAATVPPLRSYHHLIPFFNPPEDIQPGEGTWYATTCRECPAGCGLLAKNRSGRVIKAEGNPRHPVSRGALCPRGQASLQGLYNPDRFTGPAKRTVASRKRLEWSEAERLLLGILQGKGQAGRSPRVVFLTELVTGATRELIRQWLGQFGTGEHLMYESLAYEPLREANRLVFGTDAIPYYHIDQADFLISFGAGFLETWLSNVEYARLFSLFHEPGRDGKSKHPFVHVGPRRSLTAANADHFIQVKPGDEYLIAVALLKVVLQQLPKDRPDKNTVAQLKEMLPGLSIEEIAGMAGVAPELIHKIGRKFAEAQKPLALADGLSYASPNPLPTAVASNLLCVVHPGSGELVDFPLKSALSETGRAGELTDLTEKMRRGEIDLLLLHDVNPVFTLPPAWRFDEALAKVPRIVSFSSCPDETTAWAHLILPTHTPLESWGEYSPRPEVLGLMQPVMGTVFATRQMEDILIATGRQAAGKTRFPWTDFHALLKSRWQKMKGAAAESRGNSELFWLKALQNGGRWGSNQTEKADARIAAEPDRGSFRFPQPDPASEKSFEEYRFTAYPTIQFYDGRTANRPWLQELPDPIAQTTWGTWLEVHPDDASRLGVAKGDLVRISSKFGDVDAPVLPLLCVSAGTVAMPLGQGHSTYGRYASGLPANPLRLFPGEIDPQTAGLQRPQLSVAITRLEQRFAVANTDGSFFQHKRDLAATVSCTQYRQEVQDDHKPDVVLPLPAGYDRRKDFYDPHPPVDYRWCMIVDMDRCIGCGACVTACYAENNLAVVGRDRVLEGREMSWITVQRYFEKEAPHEIRFLVMLCQHCTEAPCESVCPVFAPQHNPEGINNQVYNRCIGTRDCSQNDPYKVRRFNFFTYRRPSPLDWQLNPDVTVRQKGVMEKCSFCIQRIVQAKIKARNLGRKVQDADFTTACAQTCPTNALTFGSLLNPDSRVSKLIHDPRAHQLLKHLNTKPAAIYLKKITLEI